MKKLNVLTLVLALFLAFGIQAQKKKKGGYKIGDIATDFPLKGTDDKNAFFVRF